MAEPYWDGVSQIECAVGNDHFENSTPETITSESGTAVSESKAF
jgi:hypothetical protein